MTHQVLKIFLMGRNNILRYLSILIFFTLLSACQHGWVEERNIYLGEIEFGRNVSDSFKLKSKKYFIVDSANHKKILKIEELKLKKKNFYGGPSARAKQIEVIAVLKFQLTDKHTIKNGTVSTSGWLRNAFPDATTPMTSHTRVIDLLSIITPSNKFLDVSPSRWSIIVYKVDYLLYSC